MRMQPVTESPGFAFESVSIEAPASLSERATVPAVNEFPPFVVVPEKAAKVAGPATPPMAMTKRRLARSFRLRDISSVVGWRGGGPELERHGNSLPTPPCRYRDGNPGSDGVAFGRARTEDEAAVRPLTEPAERPPIDLASRGSDLDLEHVVEIVGRGKAASRNDLREGRLVRQPNGGGRAVRGRRGDHPPGRAGSLPGSRRRAHRSGPRGSTRRLPLPPGARERARRRARRARRRSRRRGAREPHRRDAAKEDSNGHRFDVL